MTKSPITLDVLEILDAIDRRGSFARAAEELNKATSALSYGVQKLEDQLNLSIFVRQGRRSVLTPAGRLILEEGRVILGAAARLADQAQEVATGWESKLRIGVEAIVNHSTFYTVLSAFQHEQPNIEIEITETVLNGGWEALEQHRVDLVVGPPGPMPTHKGFRGVSMGNADLVAVISADHPALSSADVERLSDTDIASLQTVVLRDTSTTNVLGSAGLSLSGERFLSVQTIDQKLNAILAGLGVGHLPRYRAYSYLQSGALQELPIEPADTECFIGWEAANKGKALRALSKALQAASW